MSNNFEDQTDLQLSQYNDAGLSIMRLHEHWQRCSQYMRTGKLSFWKFELDQIRLELYHDITRQPNYQMLLDKDDAFRRIITQSAKKSRPAYYTALMRRHEFLRQLQDKAGKAGVYKDKDEGL